MPSNVYVDTGSDLSTPSAGCTVCGARLTVTIASRGLARPGMPHGFLLEAILAALPQFTAEHAECTPDRIGPDDEAWLREALK